MLSDSASAAPGSRVARQRAAACLLPLLVFWIMGTTKAQEYKVADIYTELRQHALQLKAQDIDLPKSSSGPLAVLMETGYPEAVASLVVVADGSVSMYFSNGGGMVGAGEHESVRKAGRDFLSLSSQFTKNLKPVSAFPLPKPGRVTFYVVMSNGVLSAEAEEESLGNSLNTLSPLFLKGHEVIAAIRRESGQ